MPTRSSRNALAVVMILIGTIMVASSPLSAADGTDHCTDVVVNFDDHDPRPLSSRNLTAGPVSVTLAQGTYDIVLSSSDPGHGSGRFLNQMHESWYFTLDNGYVSPVTPDFPDSETGVAIVRTGVSLTSASQITAFWAGVEADIDSVHATVSFTCARQTIASTTTAAPTSSSPTTVAPTTAASTPTTAVGSSVPSSPTTVLATPTTVTATSQALTPTTLPAVSTTPTTAGTVGEIGGVSEENPEVLAATGTNLNLAIGGLTLIAAGFGLVVTGSVHDRRKLAVVRS